MNAAREFDMPGLLGLREHLSIVHHLPGRIRLRLGVALWGADARFERERFQGLLNGLEGIRQVRVNPAVASVVIEYDPRLVPPANWETLIGGDAAMATAILRHWLARHGQLLHDTLNGKAQAMREPVIQVPESSSTPAPTPVAHHRKEPSS